MSGTEGIERENLLKLYMLLVGYTKVAIIDFFKLHLTNKSFNFEDFINLNQHDIYHLCYNTGTCCRPGCKTPHVPRRILNPVQLNTLLDNSSTRLSYHKPNSKGYYCCCRGKPGIQTDVLDVTLANCLLINFCQELFWNCCFKQGQNLTSFLDCNKHTIFHLTNGSTICCMCSGTSCSYVTQQTVDTYYWHVLFNIPSGNNCGASGTQCICSPSATVGLTQTSLDDACTHALLKQFCPARKALDILVNYRNIYGHPDKTCVPVAEYSRVKNDIFNAIMKLATLSGNETQIKQKLSDFENISLDVQLCEQYRNTLLEQINRDSQLKEAFTELSDMIKSIFQDITKTKFDQLDGKLDVLTNILCASKRQPIIDDISFANDLGDVSESSHCSGRSRFQTGLKTAFKLLSSVTFLDRNLCAVVTAVESLFKIFGDTQVEDELEKFIEDKIAEKIVCECEGTIQYFVSSVIILSGIGIESHGQHELKFVCENIKPLHAVVFMGKLWTKIDNLKKGRNFVELMNYIHCYMNVSFMRDLTWLLFCKILKLHSEHNILNAMGLLMEYQKSRDKELLQFLVKPTKNTLKFNFMYNSNDWPAIENMLTKYFFPNQKTQNPLNYLCDGEFVIKPLKYTDACLRMADIGCTWLRWSNKENEQSRFKFIQHKIDGKIYYQIFSVKWVEYYASMGFASWWTRGVTGIPDENSLWEIISFESKDYPGEDIYMFSQKDSRANFMIVDSCGRVYGSRCLPNVKSFFKIENRFVDALDEIDSDASEMTEEYEDCKDVITE